ncbi:hypothetical protein DKM44_06000 [Deinococcus irradiatisoli]|uniref:Adenylyltransferase AadA C-terminal domain-containing protein n=1 Tax=Deinococcus irradiatisoli TaxID=2202254 RepID=A0A2Z3JH39_9DEIO|nr:aminoglycoside adenylyltransferase domain-containing protein [Deinococcus irradiatisoli]AWN22831.1 hypothetical protein DKM44_06000 [Deinococcus irradiatisoli]
MTAFPELDALLGDLVTSLRGLLGNDLAGFYLVGSFAVGDADCSSDCDFLAALRRPLSPDQEAALRELHAEIPTRPGHWTRNLEGSYAPLDDLRTLERLDQPWLYVDRGWRKMQWSGHCNRLEQRWTLRECGVTLSGPQPATFAAEVPEALLQQAMARQLPTLLDDLATWTDIDQVAWGQRYAVESLCRMFRTFSDGRVHSKASSLTWAMQTFGPRWTPLLRQVQADRTRPWNPDEPPPAGSADLTRAFAREVLARLSPDF